jgi:hypothetical protein
LLARQGDDDQNTDDNWNRTGAPELTHCRSDSPRSVAGDDINFMNCPYDARTRPVGGPAQNPMPYSGLEKVFLRQWALDFCYPREECER